jgi:hypothetical protein
MGQLDVAKLVELLAVTQQNYRDLKPIATVEPGHPVSSGVYTRLLGLQTAAQQLLGSLPEGLIPDLKRLTEGHWEVPARESALMWLGALHAYLMAKLPPQEEQARNRYGISS